MQEDSHHGNECEIVSQVAANRGLEVGFFLVDRAKERQLGHRLRGVDLDRILARKTAIADTALQLFRRAVAQPVDREIAEAIGANAVANFLDAMRVGDQFFAVRRIDSIMAGSDCRRRRNSNVYLARPGRAQHTDDLDQRRPADDRIVDEYDALAFEGRTA